MPLINLYNTFSRKKEIFKPIKDGCVSMYNCGPTVYDYAHIGNLRSYVFADVLKRMFEYNSYKVKQIINITDVGHLISEGDDGDDKMTKALKRENKSISIESMREIGEFYTKAFIKNLNDLNIENAYQFPRASDHINDDLEIIEILINKEFAYKTPSAIYFDTSKFPSYGKLGNISIESQKISQRILSGNEKRNPADFALWKFDEKLGWDSRWGKGFPGWHIECSAMSRKYLGQPFDVHTGGIDHIPVHHNNEIAQSEAAFGMPLANYWLHNAFVNINNNKMAKSTGNFAKLDDLINDYISPLSYRYWLLTAHYRSTVNFTMEAIHGAQNALIKLMQTISIYPDGGNPISSYIEQFESFINDDLNTPSAIALAWELIKDKDIMDSDKKSTLLQFDKVFGLRLNSIPKNNENRDIPNDIKVLADVRETARSQKEWEKADALRIEIENRGYKIIDTPNGIIISENHADEAF